MSEEVKLTERQKALAAYRACATEAERAALYWSTPILREIISEGTHPPQQARPAAPETTVKTERML